MVCARREKVREGEKEREGKCAYKLEREREREREWSSYEELSKHQGPIL